MQRNTAFLRRPANHVLKFRVINLAHIRETNSQLVDVRAHQRVWRKAGNMVFNEHEAAGGKGRIDSPRGIGQKQDFRSHHFHKAGRKNHVRNGISFIIMNSSFHAYHRHALHIAENELSGMSRNGGYRKILDFAVINLRFHVHGIRVIAKARAKHKRYLRR